MTARLRYVGLATLRARTPLVSVGASVFMLVGVFLGRRNEVGASWALTAVACCALAAWLAGSVLIAEPEAQADIATAAIGGRSKRFGLELLVLVVAAVGLTVAFVTYPLLLGALGRPQVFNRHAEAGDVAAATLAHLSCAVLGGSIGILFAPPRITRRATALASVLATLLALVGFAGALHEVGGPLAVAKALTNADAGRLTGAEALGSLSCFVMAGLALLAASRWARRKG